MKICTKCNKEKPIEEMSKRGTDTCKKCDWKQQRAYRYKISIEELERLLNVDECEICGDIMFGIHKHIDHDHETNTVRGVLCRGCNQGLGNYKDNINRLYSAIKYLRKHGKT